MTEEERRRLEQLMHQLARPLFNWRRANGLLQLTGPMGQGARTRRERALAEIDEMVRAYVDPPTDEAANGAAQEGARHEDPDRG